uniref:Uncharacterized protein n=1 Tax=Octopus bimaculoides TaxID=37653 RepID=A0A0L8GJV6_OCTBM
MFYRNIIHISNVQNIYHTMFYMHTIYNFSTHTHHTNEAATKSFLTIRAMDATKGNDDH